MKFINSLITPKKALVFTLIAFAFLFITQGEPFYRSDAWCYYTISKSIIDKNSFVSNTKPEYYDYMEHVKETYNDNYISVCSPGVAIIQLPGLIIANIFKEDKTVYNDYFMAYNGHTLFEGVSALITAMSFALLSLVLIFKSLKLLGFGDKLSIITTGASFICSYALWYVFLNPSFTHIYEVFSVSLIVYLLLKIQKEPRSARLLIALGLSIGLSFLIRPTLIPIGLVIGIFLLIKKQWKSLGYFILGGIPTLLIWFAYNYISYGGIIASGYSVVRTENFNLSTFNGLNVLFSQYRGWLIYSPIFIFAIAGLVILYKKNKLLSIASLVSILSTVIIYGFWPSWWGGGSYGQRFLIFTVPFGAIGLAVLIQRIRKFNYNKLIYVLIALSFVYTFGLLLLYRVTIVAKLSEPYSGKIEGMYSTDRYTPFEIYSSSINLIRNSTSISDYLVSLYKNVNGGSGILAILTGTSNGVLRVDDRDSADSQHNIMKFRILTPPTMRRPLPTEIIGYYHSTSAAVFKFTISGINPGDVFEFDCSDVCNSIPYNMTMERLDSNTYTVPASEYTAIDTTKGVFYFKNVTNLQFRGLPLNIEVGVENYTF